MENAQSGGAKAMRRTAVVAALALGPALAGAQVSLVTVVEMAQRNSSAVKLAEADVRKAQAGLSESKDVLIPSVDVSTGLPIFPEVGFTGTPPSIWTANVQALIFGVPQERYIHAARLGVEAAVTNLRDADQQVTLDASTAYIELDAVNQELAAARQQQDDAGKLVQIEEQRVEAGVEPLSALLQAKLKAAQIKLNELHLESRASSLSKQLASLTGLPDGSIIPDHSSIPEIPQISGDTTADDAMGESSAELEARSKQQVAKGDEEISYLPQLAFGAQYLRYTTLLNNVNEYFNPNHPFPANNFSSGISIQVPIFNMFNRAKAKASAADALRATVEAEEAAHQHQAQIATLSSSLRELATEAEIASLKEQIAEQNVKTVAVEMESGNGAGTGPGAPPQLSPEAEELAHIDERQKYEDALEAGLQLSETRLRLMRALGHMQDWLNELHGK